MIDKLTFNLKSIMYSFLILCIFIHCAVPANRKNTRDEAMKYISEQKVDSLSTTITDEEIKNEMKFGAKEKSAAIITGSILGGIIGLYTGRICVGDNQGGQEIGDEIDVILIGGSVGVPVGAVANYFIIKHMAKMNAREKILERKISEELAKIKEE